MEDFEKELQQIASYFEKFNMTEYELRAFLALTMLGTGTPDNIAEIAKIPRTSTYKILEKLEERGLIKSVEGRPKVFKARNLYEIRKMFSENLENLFDKLATLADILTEKGEPQLIYTIYGKDKVIEKMKEMLNGAEKYVVISTPKLREIRTELGKEIEAAQSRNVQISVIAPDNQRAPPGVRIYRNNNLIATDMVVDGVKAIIAAPDLSACGFSDNPLLVEHLDKFLEILTMRKTSFDY